MEGSNPSSEPIPPAPSKKKIGLVLGAVIIVLIMVITVFLLGSNDNNSSITILTGENKIINTNSEEVGFEYLGNGNLSIGVMIYGTPHNNRTMELIEDQYAWNYWGVSESGKEPYNFDISLKFRVLNLTQDSITLDIRED